MKVFIVSFGMIIMQLSGIIFASDLFRYNNAKFRLKLLAEECAAGCAMQYDQNEYEKGNIVFDADIRRYAEDLTEYHAQNDPVFSSGRLTISGFEQNDETDFPYVEIRLSYSSDKDWFRLPLINETVISHASKYEFIVIEE